MRYFNSKKLFNVFLALLLSFGIFGLQQVPVVADGYASVICEPAPDGSGDATSYNSALRHFLNTKYSISRITAAFILSNIYKNMLYGCCVVLCGML